jgi:lysozyme
VTLTPSPACVELVQSFEGCRLAAYPDPGTGGDPWTIGWGTTGPDIHRGLVWTQQQADDRFAADLAKFAGKVSTMLEGFATTQGQFDALVSFAYNLGLGNLSSSTLLKKHRARDYAGAAGEFGKWNKAAGKVMAGLTRRRAAESALYATP